MNIGKSVANIIVQPTLRSCLAVLMLATVHCGESFTSHSSGRQPVSLLDKEPINGENTLLQNIEDNQIGCDNSNPKICTAKLLVQLDREIDDVISDKSCEVAADCGSVAIGHRACGGPKAYKLYSTLTIDSESDLKNLVNDYNDVALYYQETYESELASICSIELKPTLSCQENICVKDGLSF